MALQRKRLKLFVGVAFTLVILVVLWLYGSLRRTIRLTSSEIQSTMASKFPIEKRELVFVARFENPSVSIGANTNRVTLGVTATISALGIKAVSGRATGEGEVRYDAAKGELFLDSPGVKVENLDLKGLPERYQKPAHDLLENALREYLARNPIYRLPEQDTKLFSARRNLKSLRIEDGTLLIELGF